MGLSLAANEWITLALTFLPIFISAGILIALGVILIRAYHDEVKNKEVSFQKIIKLSWRQIAFASSFFLPVVAAYILMWIVLGIFFLLQEIPFIGTVSTVIFAFGPFLLLLGSLLLCAASVFFLFLLSPVLALKPFTGYSLVDLDLSRLSLNLFYRLVTFVVAALPVTFLSVILFLAARLTTILYVVSGSDLQMVFQWFFIMLPFAILLSPSVVFFFNMAAEAQVHLRK